MGPVDPVDHDEPADGERGERDRDERLERPAEGEIRQGRRVGGWRAMGLDGSRGRQRGEARERPERGAGAEPVARDRHRTHGGTRTPNGGYHPVRLADGSAVRVPPGG